jgi:hypothetical protein
MILKLKCKNVFSILNPIPLWKTLFCQKRPKSLYPNTHHSSRMICGSIMDVNPDWIRFQLRVSLPRPGKYIKYLPAKFSFFKFIFIENRAPDPEFEFSKEPYSGPGFQHWAGWKWCQELGHLPYFEDLVADTVKNVIDRIPPGGALSNSANALSVHAHAQRLSTHFKESLTYRYRYLLV